MTSERSGVQVTVNADPKSLLTLDQIQPAPKLPAPATQPGNRAPVEALVLYGQARDSFSRGDRFTAISQFQKAADLDPNSYQLQLDLAKAYLAANNSDPRALISLKRAADLRPDQIDAQLMLGRQYYQAGDLANAIEHLRLATQTREYTESEDQAALTDSVLAGALKDAGYDRASLDRFEQLLNRLKSPSLQLRQNPELAYLLANPKLIYMQVGELYEKHAEFAKAEDAYEAAADQDADNPEVQARLARVKASLGKRDESLALAAKLVFTTRASSESLALLRDVCDRLQIPDGSAAALRELHKQQPDDRAVLLALVDDLQDQKRSSEAEAVLAKAVKRSPSDTTLVRRLFTFYKNRNDTTDAAKLLISALAHNPDSLRQLGSLWAPLMRPSQKNRITIESVQAIAVDPSEKSAKDFWISRMADVYRRDALSRSALEAAVIPKPPFGPAFRNLQGRIWASEELSVEQRADETEKLAQIADKGGDKALAAEIRGLSLFNQRKPDPATAQLELAKKLGGNSPDLALEYAGATRKPGRDTKFEQAMWKLVSDYPLFDDGYAILFRYYAESSPAQPQQALKVLRTWTTADPQSINARVLEASIQSQFGQVSQAETAFLQLFQEYPDDPNVLDGMRSFFSQTGKPDEYVAQLEKYRDAHPENTDVLAPLVAVYVQQNRMPDAIRAIDRARNAVKTDADLLYAVAQLYARINQKDASENTLAQVIAVNPKHASASNDLGYSWADEGRNLSEAEKLVRVAVNAEPDNQSFLDSLGWVLYKRSKFAEAKVFLQKAVGPAAFPDPVVLDHLGDTLYRLSDKDAAVKVWKRSLDGIGDGDPDRQDLKDLRIHLLLKLKQASGNSSVDVAPVVESVTASAK